MKATLLYILLVFFANALQAQLVLTADGPGNTYERINAALAPGYNVVESPECVHPGFGRHIAEVWDADINQYAFEFYAHVAEDNDRCINLDRQRTEIKTYDQSPDSLIGTIGEYVTYKWRFKVPVGFQPSSSFTHIHQVKPVNGDDDQPLFTLTARKGSPNKLELIYVATGTSGSSKVAIVNLSAFEGVWVEATEQILVGASGSYSIIIKRLSDDATLLSYSNNSIATIRTDNDFIRPKWGIYRSLNTPGDLRDESLRFSMFSIKEGLDALPVQLKAFAAAVAGKRVLLQWATAAEDGLNSFVPERSQDGVYFTALANIAAKNEAASYSFYDDQPLPGTGYYRLRIKQTNAADKFSSIQKVQFRQAVFHSLQLLPNPVKDHIDFKLTPELPANAVIELLLCGADGRIYFSHKGSVSFAKNALNYTIPTLIAGNYFLQINYAGKNYRGSFAKL